MLTPLLLSWDLLVTVVALLSGLTLATLVFMFVGLRIERRRMEREQDQGDSDQGGAGD